MRGDRADVNNVPDPPMLRSTAVPFDMAQSPALGRAAHGFFGSSGGAHQFGYGGPGDPDTITALRADAARAIATGAQIFTPHQTHSCDVITLAPGGDAGWHNGWRDVPTGRPVGDALVTNRAGCALGIVTADCGPILFADNDRGVIGAAHAGWRGAQGGVIENTLCAMEALGAQRGHITAVLGPTIAQASYEVDAAFRAHFTGDDDRHFAAAPTRAGRARWHFDLPGYIVARLEACGVGCAKALGHDTYSHARDRAKDGAKDEGDEGAEDAMRYYSYRRASHNGAPNYGRQLSVISLM